MGQLGVNWPNLIFQMLAFAVLVFILYRLGYRPVLRILDERAERIRLSMETAERVEREMAEAEQRVKAQLEQARREADSILAQAHALADRTLSEARAEARREAERILARARADIEGERDRAAAELRRLATDLAVLAASRIVKETIDRQTHARLIQEALDEAERLRLQ